VVPVSETPSTPEEIHMNATAATPVEASKQACRDLVAVLEAYLLGRVSAMPVWMDGAWGDYWYVTLDGESVGEIHYDSSGPVVKGDQLSTLTYRAELAAEKA
jgi:hypothetical protein